MLKVDTKQLFANSIVELCKEKPLEKITIEDITKNCGAGRQTFYNHFKDKEDLIEYIYLSDREKSRKVLESEYSTKRHMKELLDICDEKRKFYACAYNATGQNSLSEAVFRRSIDYYTDLVIKKDGKSVLDEDMKNSIRFYSYGSLCFVKDWVNRELNCCSEELAEIIIRNAPKKLEKYLK